MRYKCFFSTFILYCLYCSLRTSTRPRLVVRRPPMSRESSLDPTLSLTPMVLLVSSTTLLMKMVSALQVSLFGFYFHIDRITNLKC